MKPDFFKFLPAEIITNILLRLSVRSIAVSKCVCKPWLHLLESDDFIASHFAQSAPALALMVRARYSNQLKLFELDEDEVDSHDPLTGIAFPHKASIQGSANGLLFLRGSSCRSHLYICNPITREFVDVFPRGIETRGFGVSRISGQHKVVSINPRCVGDRRFQCHVYTIGTGSWRLVEATDSFNRTSYSSGAFVHGNLHWMVSSKTPSKEWISCFDLETERFSSGFTLPPVQGRHLYPQLYTLRDSLSLCDESSEGEGVVIIWMMKEYGDEKSWTKEYVVDPGLEDPKLIQFHPIKVFENGDVLFLYEKAFFYYSEKAKSSREVGGPVGAVLGEIDYKGMYISSMLLTPSMVSLKKCFGSVEKVVCYDNRRIKRERR